jgi:hypothetical protein
MTTLARTFVLHGPSQAKQLHAFLKQNAAAMAEQGRPLEVRVSVYKAKRSTDQNALMWALLQQIADQAWIGGRHFDAEVWHEHFKRELLPDETARGVKKWRVLPSGHRELFMGTSDLDVAEFSAYLDALQAKAATDLGVTFDLQPA